MPGSTFRQCWCRDPVTRKRLGKACPKLKSTKHGKWYIRYDAPPGAGEKRRQPVGGPYDTKGEAGDALVAELALQASGTVPLDRALNVGDYLAAYADGKLDVKPRTRESLQESMRLYWIPALGHLRLVDLRDHHISEAITQMMRINQPGDDGPPTETMRRLLAARADDVRRELPDGEARHKKSTKPLSPARIGRVFADLRSALNAAVKTKKLAANPCLGVTLPTPAKVKPLPWTRQRVERFRDQLAKRKAAAETALDGRLLTREEYQELWGTPGLRPSPVMVWMPEHTGQFLDAIGGERLFALFCLVAYCGLRRDEVIGLAWSDVDLDEGTVNVRETGSGDGPKSEAGTRVVPIPAPVATALQAWRKVQLADRLAWGPDWPDSDVVFTREDGSSIPAQWVSVRFEILAFRAGLPPVRFHDLRHGAASLCKAAGLDSKFISAILGHSRSSFTDATYVLVFPAVAKAAMDQAAAVVPRATGKPG